MDYLITGKAPAGVKYKLRKPAATPAFIARCSGTIDSDPRRLQLLEHGRPATARLPGCKTVRPLLLIV